MVIQIHTDKNIDSSEAMQAYFSKYIEDYFSIESEQLTRIDAFLKDENAEKSGPDDKRCLIEIRPSGLQPIAVTHYAATVKEAFEGAVEKASHALNNVLGKLGRK